ncbi:hypothetical protein KKF91_08395 [Myxococcota bacterium]|nr:hypothetical protein [Myxococcota bacterium]MBU1430558.1 hypothetical protein [Myxococcota bacterium]MBU1898485.1 hypothetical protein [Myxococcota bacterium]
MKTKPRAVTLGLILLALGCTAPEQAPEITSETQQVGPPARVDLPPNLDLEALLPPETHPDNTLRIDGLLARKNKHLEQKIIVRGYLVEKYVRPKGAKRFERPHAWLADTPAGGDKRLMLVGITEDIVDALKVGEQYTITGNYSMLSSDNFVSSNGLLIYEQIEGLELPTEEEKKKNKRRRR